MEDKSELFLDMAIKYKLEYENCHWWQFKKKADLYSNWQSALHLAIKYSL